MIVGFIGGLANLLLKGGSEELKKEWLPRFARAEKIATITTTEPDAGSDAAALKTSAKLEGDYYILEGQKSRISLGMQADMVMVFAKTDPTAGDRGIIRF